MNIHDKKEHDNAVAAGILVGCAAVVLIVLAWVGASHMEAKSYNRLTGGNATTVDAMFTQLRVQGKEK